MSARAFPARAAALLAAALALPAAAAPSGSGIDLSGTAQTYLSGGLLSEGAGGGAFFSAEQYANLRLKARIGENGSFYGAANLIAASGSSAAAAGLSGDGYAASIELERLYYRIESEAVDVEAGLMRLPFGYGQAWSPADFLSARNPLLPDARTRGVLAAAASVYPDDRWKLKAFAAAPEDAASADGEGARLGLSADFHAERASFQALYAAEAFAEPIHRFGLSAKIEAGIGIAFDALCSAAAFGSDTFLDGLQASAGFDYSLLGGDLYLLAEYLWDGGGADNPGSFSGGGYLYGSAVYYVDDYTSATLDCAAALDDRSCSPGIALSRELFQGFSVALSCRAPLGSGEYGSGGTGTRVLAAATAKARF